MPKANRDWPKPRSFGVPPSEKRSLSLSSIYSIIARSEERILMTRRSFLCDLCVLQWQDLMKKYLVLIATVSLALGACERHPASQLPNEEGVAKEGTEKSGPPEKKSATPA